MTYRFRLTAHCSSPGFFALNEPESRFDLESCSVVVRPRDSDSLATAKRYHFEATGFDSESAARQAGERLRQAWQVLIAALGLRLVVPREDKETGRLGEDLVAKSLDLGQTILPTCSGLFTFPDDPNVAEFVTNGEADTYIEAPKLFEMLAVAWTAEPTMDPPLQQSLDLLAQAGTGISPAANFLATYLALETLVPRKQRSEAALMLLESLKQAVSESALNESERGSLLGALGGLKEESFRSALKRHVASISAPTEIDGLPLQRIVSESVEIRNVLAHGGTVPDVGRLNALTGALRKFALMCVWTRAKLPPITLHRPPDRIRMTKLETRLL